jgi:hypothetical protein
MNLDAELYRWNEYPVLAGLEEEEAEEDFFFVDLTEGDSDVSENKR